MHEASIDVKASSYPLRLGLGRPKMLHKLVVNACTAFANAQMIRQRKVRHPMMAS